MQFLKKNYGLFIVLILSFWAVQPFFHSGFFPMHDDTQVARVFEMGKVLKSGIFPVRTVPDLGYGYGYPIFNFYAPLAYYVGAIFMFLGFDALIATKIMMVLGIVLAGIFMYFLAREFFGEFGGVVSGLFYLYVPYHAVDIYVRGDVAEFWAYAFIPLTFLGIYKKNILIGSVGLAAIILSHNLTAMMIMPFLFFVISLNCYIAFKDKKSFIFNPSSLILIFGLAISAFYWIPVLLEMRYTNVLSQIGGGADFRDHFVCIGQLWNSMWGFGGSVAGCIDGLSFKIGKLHILASIAAFIIMSCVRRIRKSKAGSIIFLSFLGLLLSIFLMLEVSRPIWEAISVMAFFQYPWRFLILASFFSSILVGSLVYLLEQFNMKYYLAALPLIFFLLFFNTKLFVPQIILSKTAADYTSDHALKWIASKTSDEYLSPDFKRPKSPKDVYKGSSVIGAKETGIEKASNIVSLIGLLALVLGIIQYRKNMNKVPELSIFFPFWNEEKNMENVVKKAIPVADEVAKKWEMILVDDGSSDKTLEIAKSLAIKDPRLRVVAHEKNRGYGAALRTGMEASKYDLIIFNDGDGQFDFSQVSKFLEKIKKSDMVIGFRKKDSIINLDMF